jgi:hypothetical protein
MSRFPNGSPEWGASFWLPPDVITAVRPRLNPRESE